jgi:hypothetical protein
MEFRLKEDILLEAARYILLAILDIVALLEIVVKDLSYLQIDLADMEIRSL